MRPTPCPDAGRRQQLCEERAQLARYQSTRDPDLRAAIIEEHLPLARRVASRYAGGAENDDDLFQVACLGLVKAVDRFDPGRGVAFSSYAVPTMTGELKRHFRDHSWALHVTRDLQELVLNVYRARDELERRTGREPTVAEVARELSVSPAAVTDALHAASARSTRSLDEPAPATDGAAAEPVGALVGDEDPGYADAEQRLLLATLTRRLSHGERVMLRLRLAEDLTQREIARRVGVSQMTVSRALSAVRAQLALIGFSVPSP